MPVFTVGSTYALDTGTLDLSDLAFIKPIVSTSSQLSFQMNGLEFDFYGSGVTYAANGMPLTGSITELKVTQADGALAFDITQIDVSASGFADRIIDGQNQAAFDFLLSGNVTFNGGPKAATFSLDASGEVTLHSGGGDDIFGISGDVSTLVLSGNFSDYTVTHGYDYIVHDNRPGSPDGTQYVYVTYLAFADGTRPLESSQGYALLDEMTKVLRVDYNHLNDAMLVGSGETYDGWFSVETSYLEAGTQSAALVLRDLEKLASSTTSVATLTYQFFTGATPTLAGLDYLISPTGGDADNLNSTYYGHFNNANRFINFAANLGKFGAGAVGFQAAYGSLSLADATAKAYAAIYGSAPTASQVSHLLTDPVPSGGIGSYPRENYFEAYGGDGLNGIGTKAAMVGWLLYQADYAQLGTLATANTAYLNDLAAGKITGSVDLVGTYHGTAYTGAGTIDTPGG